MLDAAGLGERPGELAAELYAAGVDWIQIRERQLEGDALHRLARTVMAACRAARASGTGPDAAASSGPRLLVNRRLDVALAAGADGVHLGFDAVGPADADRLLDANALLGVSLHTLAEVQAAASEPALAYAQLAPIWDPRSKPASRPALGPAVLARACALGLPLLAQGGLDPERASAAVRAGATGIAVTGALSAGARRSMGGSAARLRSALDAAANAG